MRRVFGFVLMGAAAAAFVFGAAGLKWYVWDIAVQEAGTPDRSMLFWGIPIVFLSAVAIAAGVGLALLARQYLQRSPSE